MSKALITLGVSAALVLGGAGASRATSHPLVTDPQGDASDAMVCYQTTCPNLVSDPDLDIVAGDVTADATAVTGSVVVADLDGPGYAVGTSHTYFTGLVLSDGRITLTAERDEATGALTAHGTYWRSEALGGGALTIEGVTGSVSTATDTVSVRAPLAGINAARAMLNQVALAPGAAADVDFSTGEGFGSSSGTVVDTTDTYVGYHLGS